MVFALLAAAPPIFGAPLLAAESTHPSVAPRPKAAEGLLETNRHLTGTFDPGDPGSAVAALLADDVVLFAIPVPGLARTKHDAVESLGKAFGPGKSRVTATPIRIGLSSDGKQGFSYGFMDIVDGEVKQGKYVAYWVWGRRGWRAAAFKWVPRPQGPVVTAQRLPALPVKPAQPKTDESILASYRSSLDSTERRFSADAQEVGLGRAFRKFGSADAMNVGGAADFTYGNDAIAEMQGGDAAAPSPLRWAPDGVIVASSGDLGVTFGYLDRNGPTPPGRLARIPYFTIWRRASTQDPWLYVAE